MEMSVLSGNITLLAYAVEELNKEDESKCGKLLDVVKNLLFLDDRARNEGILGLEKAMEELGAASKCEPEEAEFLELMIEVIMWSWEPERIVEIMTNEYLTLAPKGCMAMCLYIYLRGGLMIQAIEGREAMKLFFRSLIPYSWREQYDRMMNDFEKEEETKRRAEIRKKFQTIFSSPRRWEHAETAWALSALEEQILKMSVRDVQRFIIREIDGRILAICMHGLCEEACRKLIDNASDRCGCMLMEEAIGYAKPEEEEICQNAVQVYSWIQMGIKSMEV